MLLLTGCPGVHSGHAEVRGEPGAPGVGDRLFPSAGNGGYDVRHYSLDLAYEPSTGHLSGTADIIARATQDISALNLDLRGLTVESVEVGGKKASFDRVGDEMTVRLDRHVAKRGTLRLLVRYAGRPRPVVHAGARTGWLRTADGAVAIGEPNGSMAWFPGNHHPGDKAGYSVKVTVPKGLRAVANGVPGKERPAAGRTTFSWETEHQVPSHAVTLAIGRYDMRFSAVPRTGQPVVTAIAPSAAGRGEAVLARVPGVMNWSVKRFGRYPFGAFGAVVLPEGQVARPVAALTRPVFPVDRLDEAALVRAVARQWYGGSVTPRTWQDAWLSEGFATYAVWLWNEDHHGVPAERAFHDALAAGTGPSFPPAAPPSASHLGGRPLGDRGAMLLHKVRRAVGDTTFFRILPLWAQTRMYRNATTADFTAYVEKMSGRDLDGLWDTWLYGTGDTGESGR